MTHLPLPHRYLVQFNPRRTPHYFVDVLIIGGGLAGLRAALAIPPSLDVLVVTKDKMQESNSQYAQGGIAGVLDPEDRFENHIEDTLRAGAGLCDRDVVEAVVREAPEQLEELVRWGCDFDREGGKLALTLEGGHSHRRIVHALGDATGQEVMRAVIARARAAEHVQLWEDTFTLDLLTQNDERGTMNDESDPKSPIHRSSFIVHRSSCVGAVIHRPHKGMLLVWAKQTILASGGAGCLYRETTNPPVATGDGMAIAYRAGAELRDMEFMQFHPTVLYVAGSSRCLITEAVRGEGGRLLDKNGERFMPAVDPRAELAPRDIVARAIARQMEKTRHPNVYLDLSHLDAERVRRRFPHIDRVCKSYDIDITRDPIPVRPGAHYMVGGVTVDLQGRTSVPGLWAAGEVTSSGLHGANRLASNSLLEGLVYGARCGIGAAEAAAKLTLPLTARMIESKFTPERSPLDIADSKNSLQSLMWRKAGIVRDGDGLEEALQDVEYWCRYVLAHEFTAREGWELQNMLTIARLMLWSALQREESRGVHRRSDYPEPRPEWERHVTAPQPEFTAGRES